MTPVSPLLQALYDGRPDEAERILAANPELTLYEAAATGDVRRLVELDPDSEAANTRTPDGYTPLHLAAYFDQPHAATLLLRAGASPGRLSHTRSRVQPLHSAVAGRSTAASCLLLLAGAESDARQEGGYTPLHGAAQNGDVALVELLLAYGAGSATKTDDGRTASDLAAGAGHGDLAARLESLSARQIA